MDAYVWLRSLMEVLRRVAGLIGGAFDERSVFIIFLLIDLRKTKGLCLICGSDSCD